MVSSVPSEKLKEIVEKHGDQILLDPGRCEGLLKDHCGSYRREISAIVGALEERVPVELKSSWQTAMTPEAMRARMVQRLEENRGLAPEVAGWAVDAWSYALGVGLERKSDRIDDKASASVLAGAPLAAAAATTAGLHGDRAPQGAVQGIVKSGGLAVVPAALAEMKPQAKAGIGAVAVLVIAGAAYAMLHHAPRIPATVVPDHTVVPVPPPVVPPGPTPAPPPGTGPGSGPGPNPGPVASAVLPVGTPVSISLNQGVSSLDAYVGETLTGTVVSPLTLHGNVVVPRGSGALLRVTAVVQSGGVGGRSRVNLTLVELNTGSQRYRVSTTIHPFDGPVQQANTAARVGIGAAAGSVVGFIGGKLFHHPVAGTAAGAGTGAAVGAATSAPPPVRVRPETVVQFRLSRQLGVSVPS